MIAAFARAARVLRRRDGAGLRAGAASRRRRAAEFRDGCGTRTVRAADDAIARAMPRSTPTPRITRILIFGLLELFSASGDPQWLEWGDRAAETAGRALLGRLERRMVQHDRQGSVGPGATERGLRRRRAVGERRRRLESADACTSHRRHELSDARGRGVPRLRRAPAGPGPHAADDGRGARDGVRVARANRDCRSPVHRPKPTRCGMLPTIATGRSRASSASSPGSASSSLRCCCRGLAA